MRRKFTSMVRRIGVHTSISGGLHQSLVRANALRCNTVQIFSHNPRGWTVRSISQEEISLFKSFRAHFGISPVYIHASYLINIASRDTDIRKRSVNFLVIEMERADSIGADYVILHPGSASNADKDTSMKRAIGALNEMGKRDRWKAGLLIENTAGERGDISSTIRDLSKIMEGVRGTLLSGVCIDTCHAFAAGYNISTNEGIEKFSNEIRDYIGFDKIKLVHLNDSKGAAGSGIDRHEHIGLGKIGAMGLKQFINYVTFRDVPLILETPKKKEVDDYKNLQRVRRMILPE